MTGHRSPVVAYGLKRRGYADVYNLTGGMVAWKIYSLFASQRPGLLTMGP
jgi:rhodanese-related sulfurtransferase